MSMSEVRLERTDKGPLSFCGTVLSTVSTHQPGKPRWTELTLYRTDNDKFPYVLYVIGWTTVKDETVRRRTTKCADVEVLVKALSQNGELTSPGYSLLDGASTYEITIDQYLDDLSELEETL